MVEMVKYAGTGRRKCSIARVNVTPGTGKITVNDRAFEKYFVRETDRIQILTPLRLTNAETKFDISAHVTGGGLSGQAGAFRLGLSRALSSSDPESKTVINKATLLRRDPRMKERKKPGMKGARKRFQWVKR
ncbi:MAG: 30S ribosomal protein S9 [Omnitrophica WOR_2 bacterium RIFCSPHIGHO2_01_FULL_48_9]|nr:MAG: 30S ribosomal protein S9 [Omnitrophica WOR_2 bacterium RIFCSPHIGHO2_02_FULL_48_11]OGX33695.1 MAG: 30S ribosomal protein S9 [Omnitrophica WOR_2 bacterium RIFCSPHIGHO2_01_FULL_48_9]